MTNKNLKYFLRKELKAEEVIEMPEPETIKDENGEPVIFQMKNRSRNYGGDCSERVGICVKVCGVGKLLRIFDCGIVRWCMVYYLC